MGWECSILGEMRNEHTVLFGKLKGNETRYFWDIALCSLIGVDRRFRSAYYHHRQGDDDGGSTHL
jgi:hypothetical protein